jgi:hypothetical protein
MGGWLTEIGIEVAYETKNAAMTSVPARTKFLFFTKTSTLGLLSPEISVLKDRFSAFLNIPRKTGENYRINVFWSLIMAC